MLDILLSHGYQAYFVGGYVRDRAAGREGKDIDIATSAKPEEVSRLFPRTVPTGLKHGTVTVVCPNYTFEVTTFRKEERYEQYRRPKEVRFIGDLRTDLERRDFTMNAMAMDRQGNIIDPFGGLSDLRQGILRCVGDPEERFAEDALRMLRCVRFAAEYGLTVEEKTWKALKKQREKLRFIAMERVRSEWERMMSGSDPFRALSLLFDSGLLPHLKTPLAIPAVNWSAADMPPALRRIGELEEPEARWALFMLAQGVDANLARQTLSKLTFSREAVSHIVAVIRCDEMIRNSLEKAAGQNANLTAREAEKAFKRAAVRCGVLAARRWLSAAPLLPPLFDTAEGRTRPAKRKGHELLLKHGAAWIGEIPVLRVEQLAANGHEIARAVGQAPGPWLGWVLDRLLVDVACGDMPNDKTRLEERARQYYREWSMHE